MATSYAVQAVLEVVDNASPKIDKILKLARDVAATFDKIKIAGKDLFPDINAAAFGRALQGMAPRLTLIDEAINRIKTSGAPAFDSLTVAADAAKISVEALKTQLGEAAKVAQGLRMPATRAPAAPGGSHGGGGHGASPLSTIFDAWLGEQAASYLIGPSMGFAHQQALMGLRQLNPDQRHAMEAAAWQTTLQVPTTTPAENLASIQELLMVFGPKNLPEVLSNLPTVQRISGVLGAYGGRGSAYDVAKALELKGAVQNPAEFQTEADMMLKAIGASGGRVTPSDFLQAFKYGRAATSGWDRNFTYEILPTLIQEMKGAGSSGVGGPGNALMSAYAAIVGGTVTQRALQSWVSLGLVDPTKEVWTKSHQLKGILPGGIKGSAQFAHNPFQWVQDVLAPAMKARGLTTDQERQQLQYLLPNRTAGFMVGQMLFQPWKFQRDVPMIRGQKGLSGYGQLMGQDPTTAFKAFDAAWNSLRTALFDSRAVVPILGTITSAMDHLAVIIKGNPAIGTQIDVLGGITAGILGLGVAVRSVRWAIGGLTTLSGGIRALSGANVAAAGAGLTSVAAGIAAIGAVVAGSKWWLGKTDQQRGTIFDSYFGKGAWNKTENMIGGVLDPAVNWATHNAFPLPEMSDKLKGRLAHGDLATGGALGAALHNATERTGTKVAAAVKDAGKQTGNEIAEKVAAAVRSALSGMAVILDGQQISKTVTGHQSTAASRPPTDHSGFDSRMSPLFPAFSGGF